MTFLEKYHFLVRETEDFIVFYTNSEVSFSAKNKRRHLNGFGQS